MCPALAGEVREQHEDNLATHRFRSRHHSASDVPIVCLYLRVNTAGDLALDRKLGIPGGLPEAGLATRLKSEDTAQVTLIID